MSNASSNTRAAAQARVIRRERARRLVRRFLLWVAFPTLVAVTYYGFWDSDEYQSTVVFTIQSSEANDSSGIDALANIVPGQGSSSNEDEALARELIRSRTMLEELVQEHGLVDHYTDGDVDWISRLDAEAGSEETYEYYLDHVSVSSEGGAGLMQVDVRAFSPERARDFAHHIVEHTESMLNRVVARSHAEQAGSTEALAKTAGARARKARARLAALETDGFDTSSDEYVQAEVEKKLAERAYEAALEAVALARLQGERNQRYVVVVDGPSLPNEAVYPRRLWNIATVFVVAMALMGLLSLLAGAVREHAKF